MDAAFFFWAIGCYILIQILGTITSCLAFHDALPNFRPRVACQDTGQSGGSVSIDTAIAVAQSLKNLRLEDPNKFSNHRCKRSTWFQTSKKTLMVSLANLFTVFFFMIFLYFFIYHLQYFCWWSLSGKKTMPALSTAGGCCCHKSGGQGDDWCVGGELSWQTPGSTGRNWRKSWGTGLVSRWTANPRVLEVEGWLTLWIGSPYIVSHVGMT